MGDVTNPAKTCVETVRIADDVLCDLGADSLLVLMSLVRERFASAGIPFRVWHDEAFRETVIEPVRYSDD